MSMSGRSPARDTDLRRYRGALPYGQAHLAEERRGELVAGVDHGREDLGQPILQRALIPAEGRRRIEQ
jgi:hypothetical protein